MILPHWRYNHNYLYENKGRTRDDTELFKITPQQVNGRTLTLFEIDHRYIHGGRDSWVSYPNVSTSYNSPYFLIYNIYMDLSIPKY